MDMINLVVDGTMRAAVAVMRDRNIQISDEIIAALRETMNEGYFELIAEMKEALDANMGDGILRAQLSVGCQSLAVKALKKAEVI